MDLRMDHFFYGFHRSTLPHAAAFERRCVCWTEPLAYKSMMPAVVYMQSYGSTIALVRVSFKISFLRDETRIIIYCEGVSSTRHRQKSGPA